MHEITGDLFESEKADAICILTNGFINAQGANTMGKGCALGAKQRWPGKLKFVSAWDSIDRFPICAAVRKEDIGWRETIDWALAELAQSGELAKVFAHWHVPYTPHEKAAELSP